MNNSTISSNAARVIQTDTHNISSQSTDDVNVANASAVEAIVITLPTINNVPYPNYRLPTGPNGLFIYSDARVPDQISDAALASVSDRIPTSETASITASEAINIAIPETISIATPKVVDIAIPETTNIATPKAVNISIPDPVSTVMPDAISSTIPAPAMHYLIETNPLFTDLDNFVGSDYFLNKVDFSPEDDITFLGDAFYDTRTITQSIFEQTGKRYLNNDIGTELDQMQALIDAAAKEQSSLDLSVGVSLSPDQVARLSSDIV